jgi:hypothetical protein
VPGILHFCLEGAGKSEKEYTKLMEECCIGSLTIYDVRNKKDELLKFSSATVKTKAITNAMFYVNPSWSSLT